MLTNKWIVLALTAGFVVGAQAQTQQSSTTATTNESSAKISDLQSDKEKAKDIDEEITDARMRATLGSKSKWSLKMAIDYSGASIESPLDAVRPNYRASASSEALTSLSGTVGANFRFADRHTLGFGTGLTVNDPLHGDITKNATDSTSSGGGREIPRTEIATPYLSWSAGYRALGTQMSTSVTYSHYTDDVSVNRYMGVGSVSFSQVFLANLGNSGWTGGTSVTAASTIWSGEVTDPRLKALKDAGIYKRSLVSYGLFPFAQYAFNDRYSFRTVFGYFQFANYFDDSNTYQLEPYQSVGIGISITRDIYLYPNVQFVPKDIRSDRTNVALSTNINLF